MTVQVLSPADAPREVFSINPFAKDERCDVFQVVLAPDRESCIVETISLHQANIAEGSEFGESYIFDWDYVYDNVTNQWVGFTCKDKEPFDAAV